MLESIPVLDEVGALLHTGPALTLAIVIIILGTIIVERVVRAFLHHSFKRSSKIIKVDHTQFVILKHFFTAIIYLSGLGMAIYLIPPLRTLAVSVFASAGILAIIVGFASQKAFANIVSGIFIAMFKPFRVGDLIGFGDKKGRVEDITLRHTVIKSFENKRYIVPNTIISDEVIENFDIGDEKVCKFVEFGISYDSDVDKAMKIMRDEAIKHPLCIDNRTQAEKHNKIPQVAVRVLGYGDSSVNLRAWVWTKNPDDAYHLGWDLNYSIKKKFDKAKIEIPFPHRTLVMKKSKKR